MSAPLHLSLLLLSPLLLFPFFTLADEQSDYLYVAGRDFLYEEAICRWEHFFPHMRKECADGWDVSRDGTTDFAQSRLKATHEVGTWHNGYPLCCRPLKPFANYSQVPECRWEGNAPMCRGQCEANWLEMTSAKSVIATGAWQEDFGGACYNGEKVFCCKK